MRCPYCQTELPDGSLACTKCDWVAPAPVGKNETRDRVAAILSIIPGLGHLYKGHIIFGGLIFFVIGPAILALSLAVIAATLGVSLIIPAAFMLAVAVHAFNAPDRRSVVPSEVRKFEGESVHAVPGVGESVANT